MSSTIHLFKIRGAKTEVFCCLRFCIFQAKILFCMQRLVYEPIFTFMSVFIWKLRGYKELEIIRALTVKSKFGQKLSKTLNS